jgi:hypothetical protein
MDRHPLDLTTDEEIDQALAQAKDLGSLAHVVEASYRSDPGWACLALLWSDGHRMLIPKEMLGELKDATSAQAADVEILPGGLHLWWPQLDDGLYLPDFLEHRWGKAWSGVAA